MNNSTIDFASYNKHGVECFTEGFCHGASRVEREICKYFRENDSSFKKAEEEIKNFDEMRNNWYNIVLNYVKKQKEDFYTKELGTFHLDLSNRVIDYGRERIFDSVIIDQQLLENTILKDYKLILKNIAVR